MNKCILCGSISQLEARFCFNCLLVTKVEYRLVSDAQVDEMVKAQKEEEAEDQELLQAVKELESCKECYEYLSVITKSCGICDEDFLNYSCHEDEKNCQQCKNKGSKFLC